MTKREVNCKTHGPQGIGLVCSHIALAVDRGEQVGFHWGDDVDHARPDAWCSQCEQALVALNGASSEEWFKAAGFKVFCALCWDHAKQVCGWQGEGTPLVSREEFARRLEASRREESRYGVIWLVCFFAFILLLMPIFRWIESPWLGGGMIALVFAVLFGQVLLLLRYFKDRTRRFGLLCPSCGTPLSGQAGPMVLELGYCPVCKSPFFID